MEIFFFGLSLLNEASGLTSFHNQNFCISAKNTFGIHVFGTRPVKGTHNLS